MAPVATTPLLAPFWGMVVFVASLVLFERICHYQYAKPQTMSAAGYFSAEKRLSIAALVFFIGGALYLCDGKYYLSAFLGGERFSGLVNIVGLAVFFVYFSIMWQKGLYRYSLVFGREYLRYSFVFHNLKSNLPIVLPWVVLSLVYDFLSLLPVPQMAYILDSEWDGLFSFLFFLSFIVVFFPPLVCRLWSCIRLPPGPLRDQLHAFSQSQQFSAALYVWPLFEGRMLTAAVIGIVPGLRYILLTPGLLALLTMEEVVAVVAHEIGHVKRRHLLFYALLLGGFALFMDCALEPCITFFLATELPLAVFEIFPGADPDIVFSVLSGIPLLLAMILYFRFFFGYFMRNFERQADLYAVTATGSDKPLVAAFEKIARMSGNIRDAKNWHHFGIGERITCIEQACKEPEMISRHDRKVGMSLLFYLVFLAIACIWGQSFSTEELELQYNQRYTEAVLLQKIYQEPGQAHWPYALADLMLRQGNEKEASLTYEKAHALDATNSGIRNNWAWLLVTSRDPQLRDPQKALELMQGIPEAQRDGPLLDTLATVYWAHGLRDQAVELERQAALLDPERAAWYRLRAHGFVHSSYEEMPEHFPGNEEK